MYREFFRLKEIPFGESPDPRFYFAANAHEQTLRQVEWSIENDRAFSLILGESGTGKTLISRVLFQNLKHDCDIAFLVNPLLSPEEILGTICAEFKIPALANSLNSLNDYLIRNAERGRRSLLIIDEAQALKKESLEFIRLLTNLESAKRKLLQIVMIAQPEMENTLQTAQQLAQRVYLRIRLEPIGANEVGSYLSHRLEIAGAGNFVRFDHSAALFLHQISRGIPRLLNKAAETSLQFAAKTGKRQIDSKFLQQLPWAEIGLKSPTRLPWPFHKGISF